MNAQRILEAKCMTNDGVASFLPSGQFVALPSICDGPAGGAAPRASVADRGRGLVPSGLLAATGNGTELALGLKSLGQLCLRPTEEK